MDKLRIILTKLQERLEELETVLSEEIKQLSFPNVNHVALQCISDSKSRLLSAVNFYDLQRRDVEKRQGLKAPYNDHVQFKLKWKAIEATTKRSNEMNQRSYNLLEVHLQKAQALKKMVKSSGITHSLYESSGKTEQGNLGQVYNIKI
jgi:flagella synthesis protein FlgN